ncbi:NmrA family transcriptional regulator [Planctomycetota bacterium]|nr:NmrA family transcriptional regulator [Planctomycetota bacterium]
MNANTNSKMRTLVMSAGGKTGRRVMERLKELDVEVRKGSRRGERPFDWAEPEGWGAALEGMEAAYVVFVPDLVVPGADAAIERFVGEAEKAGLKKMVLLSGRGEKEAEKAEQIFLNAEMDTTVVRASWFDQNFSEGEFLPMIKGGHLVLPVDEVGEPFVDVGDIADVVVAALLEAGHDGAVYEVTGPRLMSFDEAVGEIAKVTGREIGFEEIPMDAFLGGLKESQLPSEMVDLMKHLFGELFDGRNESVSGDVEKVLGRKPRDFSEYVKEAAASDVWG